MTIGSLVAVFPGVCSDGFPESSMGDHQDAPQRPDTAIPYVIRDCAVLGNPFTITARLTVMMSKPRYGGVVSMVIEDR